MRVSMNSDDCLHIVMNRKKIILFHRSDLMGEKMWRMHAKVFEVYMRLGKISLLREKIV